MKHIFFFTFAMLCITNVHAQGEKKATAPANVKAAFAKEYAASNNVKWEKEHGSYEASFTSNGKKMSVVYSAAGVKEETETSIAPDKLPAAAKKYAEAKGKIKDAAEIIKADGSIVYEAEVNGRDLIFDKNGKFIKETKD